MVKAKKPFRIVVRLDGKDVKAMESGMKVVGEDNMSSYIRRLIHEHKGYSYIPGKISYAPED